MTRRRCFELLSGEEPEPKTEAELQAEYEYWYDVEHSDADE